MKLTGEELNKCACVASSAAVRIYNIIRKVGHGELTADNALHQLVEDMKNIRDLSTRLQEMSKSIPWDVREKNTTQEARVMPVDDSRRTIVVNAREVISED